MSNEPAVAPKVTKPVVTAAATPKPTAGAVSYLTAAQAAAAAAPANREPTLANPTGPDGTTKKTYSALRYLGAI